jgi:alpha-L-arabinofuranosidase
MTALLLATACEDAAAPGSPRGDGSGDNRPAATSGLQRERPCPSNTDPVIPSTTERGLVAGEAATEIVVDASVDEGPISPLVYGANHRYPYNGFDMWNARTDEPFPLFLERYNDAGLTAVRFPGGRTANNYHWQRAIGPLEERIGHVDAAFGRTTIHGQTLTNEFGPDEFGEFLEDSGSGASIVANFATASAREVANWVEYMNTPVGENPHGGVAWAEVRASNGQEKPYGVEYWEIGNELAGEKTFWLGEDTDPTNHASKYIFGGSSHFERQRTVRLLDYSPSASLSTGDASQVRYIAFPPAKPGSETVYVGDEAWERVDDLGDAGARDVYEFAPTRGRIRFGDGTNGNIPPKGAEITITHVSGPHDGFNDFYREMKEVDPSIKVGSGLNSPQFLELMGSTHPYDFLVAHSYSFFDETPTGMRQLHDLMMYLPEDQAAKVAATKELIAASAGTASRDVAITEWAMSTGNTLGLGRIDAPLSYTQSLDSALYTALILRHWIEMDVPLAQKHTLIDIDPDSPPRGYTKIRTAFQAVIGPYPCFVLSASAHTFRLFTNMMGEAQVASEVIGNPARQIFNGETLEALATLAGIDDNGDLYLIVINKETKPISAKVTTSNFSEEGPATAWAIAGDDLLASNTAKAPNAVGIKETVYQEVEDGFIYEFPANSVTSIKLPGNG